MNADPRAIVVVDTNVLLSATDTSRAAHAAATTLLNIDERRLTVTPQIVREYLAVTTRPLAANGFGLSGADAVANVTELLEDMEVLPEGVTSTQALLDLIGRGLSTGKQVHDANVVSVAVTNGAQVIVTDDGRHLSRFADLIDIESLSPPQE